MSDGSIVLATPEAIEHYRLAVLEKMLKLESLGMRNSRGPVATQAAGQILRNAGLKPERNKKALYEQYKAWRTGQVH